jgi:cytochrome-b5 reductase
LRKLLDDKSTADTKISLVFANIGEQDILFKEELDGYAAAYPDRFKVHYVLENHGEAFSGSTGYVTRDLLETQLHKDAVVFVCGPPPFMVAVSGDKAPDKSQGTLSGYLLDLNYPQDRVFKL